MAGFWVERQEVYLRNRKRVFCVAIFRQGGNKIILVRFSRRRLNTLERTFFPPMRHPLPPLLQKVRHFYPRKFSPTRATNCVFSLDKVELDQIGLKRDCLGFGGTGRQPPPPFAKDMFCGKLLADLGVLPLTEKIRQTLVYLRPYFLNDFFSKTHGMI